MVRGHAKAVAQQKNQAKMAEKAGSVGRTGAESAAVKNAGITTVCPTCKAGCPNIGALKDHYINKHPKLPLPPELQ